MVRSRLISFCLTLFTFAVSNMASGQIGHFSPPSGTEGYASRELRSIYRSGIGTGFSGAELNRNTQASLRAQVPSVGQAGNPRVNLGAAGRASVGRPFDNFNPAPTVSPYLNLFREDLSGNDDFNYNTLVRPMLEQQRVNDQLQRQSYEIQRRLQAIAAQPDFSPQGNPNQAPTGHQTVFQYHSHFYPQMSSGRRR
jgi:hypothetical protein